MKPQFIESIKVKDGNFCNLQLHANRMYRTIQHFYDASYLLRLSDIDIPDYAKYGLFKCRIVYADEILSIEYQAYIFKEIKSLAVVDGKEIDYAYKSTDRLIFNSLLASAKADEVLIAKSGYITDSTFSNLVFEDETGLYTPTTFLLNGVKRQALLAEGIIKEREIRVEHIKDYTYVYLINAMIDIADEIKMETSQILY